MLQVNIDVENKLVVLEPEGALTKEDFDNAVKLIDPFIEQNGKLNGIVIYTESFPGWEDFAALTRHIVFIKNHHQKIKRLAFATNTNVIDYTKSIAAPFVSAKIEVFPFAQFEKAKAWVSTAEAE
jgi:hypothetical protein